MGLRAIPVGRVFAQIVTSQFKARFAITMADGEAMEVDPVVVFGPAMYLPAIVAQAEAIAQFNFQSTDVLGVKRSVTEMGLLGVECDVLPIDGSPGGILRGLLLTHACEQVFNLRPAGLHSQEQLVDLTAVTNYYRSEGASAVRGERPDVLMKEISINGEF